MNKILDLTCALLSGCALAGLEGPERQAKAQETLRNLPGEVAQIPAAIGNDPDYGGGYVRGSTMYAYLFDGKVSRIVCNNNLGLGLEVQEVNILRASNGSGIWSKPPGVEFYKRRAAIAAMAFRYAKHHPGHDYIMAAMIGAGVNDAYPTITVTALDIAKYIQTRDLSIPWNVCVMAGEYMETWVTYSRLGFDALAASEILSQGVSNGLKGKIE